MGIVPLRDDDPGAMAVRPEAGVDTHDTGSVVDEWMGRLAASDGMFVTDDHQRIIAWSSAAQRMLGFSPEETVGRTCFQVVMGREPDGHPVCGRNCAVTRNARRHRGTASYEVVAHGRDGEAKCLSNSVIAVEGPDGAFHVIHLLRESAVGPGVTRRRTAMPPAEPVQPLVETLTRRELEVLRLLAAGATTDEIGATLTISVLTARNHISSVGRKRGAHSRLETVLQGMRRGLV